MSSYFLTGLATASMELWRDIEIDSARVTDFIWTTSRSEEHTSELQSQSNLVCRLLLEKKNTSQYLKAAAVLSCPADLLHSSHCRWTAYRSRTSRFAYCASANASKPFSIITRPAGLILH